MMESFAKTSFFVKGTDCGAEDSIMPAILLGDLQENAEDGVRMLSSGTLDLNAKNCCWIILRMTVRMDKNPCWRDAFSVNTWSRGANKFYFYRDFEIFNSNEEKIGAASSTWIIADMTTHRPLIPGHIEGLDLVDYVQSDRMALDYDSPKLSFPKDISELGRPVITKYADYSELDKNHHVNNTRYAAWFYDALHKYGMKLADIKEFTINYISEVYDSEKVDLYVSHADDSTYFVYGVKNEGDKVFVVKVTV